MRPKSEIYTPAKARRRASQALLYAERPPLPPPPEWRTLALYSPPHFLSYLQTSETQRYLERSCLIYRKQCVILTLTSFNFVHFSTGFASRFMLFHPELFLYYEAWFQAIEPQFAVVCARQSEKKTSCFLVVSTLGRPAHRFVLVARRSCDVVTPWILSRIA